MHETKSYVCDFETNTNHSAFKSNPVWLWAITGIDSEYYKYGTCFSDFFNVVGVLGDCTLYFHNLKFDGEFIVSYLLRNGYSHSQQVVRGSSTFNTLISSMGQWYRIKAAIGDSIITILDSLKRIPLKVEQIPRAFNLEETKGAIDYDLPRYPGYQPTKNEVDYIRHDVSIVAKALAIMDKANSYSMTVGANAIRFYQEQLATALYGVENPTYKDRRRAFTHFFPKLGKEEDEFVRRAYLGGWTYANPATANRLTGAGSVYDVNSLYPSVMRTCPMPYGRPVCKGVGRVPERYCKDGYVYVQRCMFKAKLRKRRFPMLKVRDSERYLWNKYIVDTGRDKDGVKCNPYVVATLTSVDLKLLYYCYHVKMVCYCEYIVYKSRTDLFAEYIDYWTEQKIKAAKAGNQGLRTISKLYLNNLYGKFGTNPQKSIKIPKLDNGIVKFTVEQDRYDLTNSYIPVAAFCTAYARDKTVRAAIDNYDRFLYADTDSLHLIGEQEPDLDIDDYKLGYWAHESNFSSGKYLGAKCYAEKIDGKWSITVAGMPDNCKAQINVEQDFKIGLEVSGKLVPKHYGGGIILTPTTFKIKAR